MPEFTYATESESALLRERSRLAGLMRACRRHGLDDKYDAYVKADLTEADVDDLALGRKAASARISNAVSPRVEVTVDSRDKFVKDMNDSLALRAGVSHDRSRASEISHPGSLPDLARRCLTRAGVSDRGLTNNDIVQRAISHSTSDFANILSNVANKALVKAYTEAPATWKAFATVTSIPNFKERSITGLGSFPDLLETKQLEPMVEASMTEKATSYSLATFSRRFGLSRECIVNDDLNMLTRTAESMGAAARRVPAKLFYDLLVSSSGAGPICDEDGLNLFSTQHVSGSNTIEAAGAIAVATLGAAKALIRRQCGAVPQGETPPELNLTPSYLLVPTALEAVALQFTTQITPNQGSAVSPLWQPGLTVVCEPRLDSGVNGTTAWYLVVPPSQISCAEVAFLGGKEEPTMIRQDGTNILGVEWGVYLDCAAKFVDHRGWFRQRGA